MGFRKIINGNISSDRLPRQIWGALLKRWWLMAPLLAGLALLLVQNLFRCCGDTVQGVVGNKWYGLLLLTFGIWLAISVCRILTNLFNLRKQESGITWCQISILIAIGVWILGFLLIFNIQQNSRYFFVLCIVGSLVAFIFQDALKGVVAFMHLRLNHLLCIDDWIEVPQHKVDGEVKRVTLTTVTVYNWDTSTSSIPTSALYSGHFINYQKIVDGKTYGRRMLKAFILDTEWFHALSAEEAVQLKRKMKEDNGFRYLPEEEIHEGAFNAQLYRLYLYHWLLNHPHISHMPRLVVRWQEQVEQGMPLQVYAYITDGSLAAFEWQQSQIIEHLVAALEWFSLRLYQKPSGYDASNNNIHLTDNPATYGKEAINE